MARPKPSASPAPSKQSPLRAEVSSKKSEAAPAESGRVDGLPAPTTEQLVSAAILLHREIEAKEKELAVIAEKIVALGKGKHSGFGDHVVTVVAASLGSAAKVSYPPVPAEDLEQARALAGAAWPKLFTREVVHTPCEGFEHVAPALLPPKTSEALLDLCRHVGEPGKGKKGYVIYPKEA